MYIYALYIGLCSLLFSLLYFSVIPYYVQQVHQGELANKRLFGQSLLQGIQHFQAPSVQAQAGVALAFGLVLALSVADTGVLLGQLTYSLYLFSVWLMILAVLACIDARCYLLPDVGTQLLLWIGLAALAWQQPAQLVGQLVAVLLFYGLAVFLYQLSYCYTKKHLFGLGDVKLLVALIPWLGLSALLYVGLGACLLCYVHQIHIQGRWRPQGHCAFGPYLAIAGGAVGWLGVPSAFILPS